MLYLTPVGQLHDSTSGTLRLVGSAERSGSASRSHAGSRRRAQVATENLAAAALDTEDARLIFALRVAERLEGGRAAILAPESRRRLQSVAARMGLEPFDASLVIAIVQDAARRGEATGDPMTTGRLRLVRPAERGAESLLLPAASALLLALLLLTLLAAWILTG